MRSIQATLLALLVPTMALLAVAAGAALDVSLRHALVADFDATLRTRAEAIRALTIRRADGTLDFESAPDAAARFADPRAGGVAWFAVRDAGGRLVAGSPKPLFADGDAPDAAVDASIGERPADVTRADRVPARAIAITFTPEFDEDEDARQRRVAVDTLPAAVRTARLVFAQDRRPLDRRLRRVDLTIVATFALLAGAAAVVSGVAVRRGLRPLRGLAARVGAIEPDRADAGPLADEPLPGELRPIAARIDELLARVAAALARERRFTASAAHELRTPIAELRLAAELALRDPANAGLAQRSARQSLEIARQMHATTAALLDLARATAAEPASGVELVDVPLAAAVARAAARHAATGVARGVTIDVSAASGRTVARASAAMLDAVLDNLLDNACRYADAGTAVRVGAGTDGDCAWLRVENAAADATAADAERMFEPFWRRDAARTDGSHVGLGLAIVRAYAAAMRGRADATIGDGVVRVTVRLAAGDAVAAAATAHDATADDATTAAA